MLTKKDLDRIERSVAAHLGVPVVAYCAWDPRGQAVGVMLRDGRADGFLHVLSPRLASLEELHAELRTIVLAAAHALAHRLAPVVAAMQPSAPLAAGRQ